MIAPGPAAMLILAALGASQVSVEPRRRCNRCRMPSNRCPCKHCHSCTTDGGEPGDGCACGKSDRTGEGERSPKVGGSPVRLIVDGEP
jgi:hypothetical protein